MNDEAKVAELENMSLPPTKEELARMNDVSIDILPKPYKRGIPRADPLDCKIIAWVRLYP
jgi:hypothetical protein